jgi:hypothetical protein
MFEKRLLFLTKDQLTIFSWKKGGIAGAPTRFAADEEGHKQFAEAMSVKPEIPVTMLVDLIEEEYRNESMPHVFGPDQRALHQRRASKAFPSSPFNYLEVQGREEKKGRKDDLAMIAGITEPDMISVWLDILTEKKVSLAGIYSLPLLSRRLLKPLDAVSPATLVVSWQSTSGLRFSFFINNHLKMSRMAPVPEPEPKPYSDLFVAELAKTREYLGSLRLIPKDTPLQVVLFTNPEMLDAVRPKCIETATLKFRLMTVNVVARKIGIKRRIMTPFSDSLFVQLLGKQIFGNHYAPVASRGYYFTRSLKSVMYAAAVIIGLSGLVTAGSSLYTSWEYYQKWQVDATRSDELEKKYKKVIGQYLPTSIDPGDVRKTVVMMEKLEKRKTDPRAMMLAVSKGLENFPNLRMDELIWNGPESSEVAALVNAKNKPRRGRRRGRAPAPQSGFVEVGTISGEITDFQGDIEVAISTINEFMNIMLANKQIQEFTPLQMPSVEKEEAVLSGDIYAKEEKKKKLVKSAPFSFRIVLKGAGNAK